MNPTTAAAAPENEHLRELCEGWLCNALSDKQKATFVSLLRDDPQAAARLADYLEEWHLLATVAHQQQTAAAMGGHGGHAAPLPGPGHRHHSPWTWVSAAAAAIAAAVLWLALPPATARHSETLASVSSESTAAPGQQPSIVLRPQADHNGVTLVHDLSSKRRVVISVRQQGGPPQP